MLGVLGNAATVAQLVGFDAASLIAKIRQAARTAQQNKDDCELLARRVDTLGELLPRLMRAAQEPEAVRALAWLDATLQEAHDLVMSCQGKGRVHSFFTASRTADRFRLVEKKIDSYLSLIPVISHIGITSRLDLDANHTTTSRGEQELVMHREFTLAEIAVATNNFAVVLSDDAGGSGTKVYKGKLRNRNDGHAAEVAVKRLNRTRRGAEDAFFKERHILSPLRHDGIVRLLGTCADDGERILVTEYMPNGSLHDHLHGHLPSPVTASWKARVRVLLGAARAVEHLHRHASPLVIHCNVASSNILLDAAWGPRLSGFGASLWQAAGVDSQPVEAAAGGGGGGYTDPEYCATGRVRPASDVYGLGVVMLEALTGQPPMVSVWDDGVVAMALPSFALPRIQAGRLGDVLDRRPAPAPTTSQQLQPLQLVANTAARCLSLHGDNRPAISDVVANLEQALRLIM